MVNAWITGGLHKKIKGCDTRGCLQNRNFLCANTRCNEFVGYEGYMEWREQTGSLAGFLPFCREFSQYQKVIL